MSIQTQAFISYYSSIQGRMADANTGVYEFDSMVRGLHVYKSAWTPVTPLTNEMCNEPRHLFHSFCCTTQHIAILLCMDLIISHDIYTFGPIITCVMMNHVCEFRHG